jgi:hypothetical protein
MVVDLSRSPILRRCPTFPILTCAVLVLTGIVRAEERNGLLSTREERIDLNSVFAEDDAPIIACLDSQSSCNRISNQRRIGIDRRSDDKSPSTRLVAHTVSSEPISLSTAGQAPATPIYVMKQSVFQLVDGDSYTGPSATRGTWVLIAPYAWAAGVNGQVGAAGRVVNVDITPGEVLSNLGSIDGALMLHTEAGRGDWGFILDANLVRAGTSVTTPAANVDVTLQQTMIETLGMYRIVEMSDYWVDGKSLSVDLLAGARFYEFGNILTVRSFDPTLPPVIPLNLSSTWVDMVIGGRVRAPITNSLDVFGRADIGGFGIGSSSILAWNLIGGVDWKMTSCSSLIAGYRELNINKTGGVGGTAFDFNAKLYGPFVAVSFQF